MNLEKVFNFIKEKRGYDYPVIYKLINGLPLNDNELYFKDDLELINRNIKFLPDNLKFNSDLFLDDNPLSSLPDNLYVGGTLDLSNTPLSNKYSEELIRKMIEDKGGYVRWDIFL